jgi:hypothetical protein
VNTTNLGSFIDCTITVALGLYFTLGRSRIVAKIIDPLKKEKAARVLKWTGPVVIVCGIVIAAAKLASVEDPATRAARMINSSSPKMVDAITRFDRATPEAGQRVVIDQTIITMTAAQVPKQAWEAFVPQLRKNIENSGIGKFPAQGLTIVYRYRGSDGILIGELVLTPPSKKT